MPNIEIDQKSGFCFGVVKAITKAEEELAKAVEPQEQMQEPPQDLPPQAAPEQAIDPAMLEQMQQSANQPIPNQ